MATGMTTRLADALQDCLVALATGQAELDEVPAPYLDLAADLGPLLQTSQRLQRAYNVEPSPVYVQAARERFLAALAGLRQRAPQARSPRARVGPPRTASAGWDSPPRQTSPTVSTSEG